MSSVGIAMALLFELTLPFPLNVLVSGVPLVGFGYFVYFATRNDYTWVELDGETIRAQHLYTRQIVERSIDEIEELVTMFFQIRSATTLVTEAWIGRVRSIEIRFGEHRRPLRIGQADPAMKHAKDLMQTIGCRI